MNLEEMNALLEWAARESKELLFFLPYPRGQYQGLFIALDETEINFGHKDYYCAYCNSADEAALTIVHYLGLEDD